MNLYFDPEGNPITLEEWATMFEHRHVARTDLPGGYRHVARTDLPGGKWVSTVYLGINHNLDPEGPPLIYETMVFGPHGFGDIDMDRYSTRKEAEAGHRAMVRRHIPWWRLWLRRQWK